MNEIDKEIEVLLLKKHSTNTKEYDFKKTKISVKTLKLGLTDKHFITNRVIEIYLRHEKYLCYYDTDIINLIILYIIKNNKLIRIEDKSDDIIDKVYNLLGYEKEIINPNKYKKYRKDHNYFNSIYPLVNCNILDNFKHVCENIILKFS